MSDMMKMFVEQELQNQIKENYPHMQYPPGLYAKVVSVRTESCMKQLSKYLTKTSSLTSASRRYRR